MTEIELYLDGKAENIKIEESDYNLSFKDIIEKDKGNIINKNGISKFCFLYEGNKLDTEKPLKEIIKNKLEEKIYILVFPLIEDKLYKSKQILCPEPGCGKFLIFNIVYF